jgi:hypothetical protein
MPKEQQGKQPPAADAASPTEQMEANVTAALPDSGEHESTIKQMRAAVRAWQRSDELHDVLHEIAAGDRQAPILSMTIRGRDGQPQKVEVDLATWDDNDRSAYCNLMISNTSAAWLKQLTEMKDLVNQADAFYEH